MKQKYLMVGVLILFIMVSLVMNKKSNKQIYVKNFK